MATPREHIEQIRKAKFSIGGEQNPLTEDLHQAVKNLSAELYAKDVHFLMELIQNAEDNEYPEGEDPSLEFVVTSRDITGTGAPATLLMFNNEKGFSQRNIESICSVGRSTKKGHRKRGYIGEKGIGFKSVFLITSTPYIFSNGYQIRFNEGPCPHCNLGYIVPEWVEENPTLADVKQVYGNSKSSIPTTTLVLPLKPDKVKPVKQQLSSVHPEVLLFLSKIKRLSVREHNEDPSLNTVSAIAITSETNFVTRKNIDAESYTLRLAADEEGNNEKECSYYMWKQRFPVKPENRVERRMGIDEWVITLAFPNQERLHKGTTLPGVYAFLPTDMVTNFPFIIQADFVLQSSREAILLDDKWNQGILDCVPSAFLSAFISLVKTTENAPISSIPRMFHFLPVNPYEKLNSVRESIREKLVEVDIVPSEPYTEQKFFHKPREVGRLMPAFWDILNKARNEGITLPNLSSHGRYILHSSFDRAEYDQILNFLGVSTVNNEWYANCIRSSNLVLGVSDNLYVELLLFIADHWLSNFQNTNIKNIPLLKYVGLDDNVALCPISEYSWSQRLLCLSQTFERASWMIDWNREFRCASNLYFMPERTLQALRSYTKKETVTQWLRDHANVVLVDVYDFAVTLSNNLPNDRNLVVTYSHFLYHSFSKDFLSATQVGSLCNAMPLIDNYGCVTKRRAGVLVPASESKWAGLVVSNLWKDEGFVELGEDYLRPGNFAGQSTKGKELMGFLKSYAAASDVPDISAPNAGIPAVSGPLTKENTFVLLDWIRHLTGSSKRIPEKFLNRVKNGSWLRVSINGSSGYRPPSQSFFRSSSWGDVLQNGSVLIDIPLLDQRFYGDRINGYKEALRTIGVMFEYGEACRFIGQHLMSLAASSSLSRVNVLSILNFIRYLREKLLPPDEFIGRIKKGNWLWTSRGYWSPAGAVLFDQEWKTASEICNIPFIDQGYYGDEILSFRTELELLGVVVGFRSNLQLVADYLKSSSGLSLKADAVVLLLECMQCVGSSEKLVAALTNIRCLKTNLGYKFPGECFLLDPEWGCLLQVFNCFPIIDLEYYGSAICSYRNELKELGVVTDFKAAAKAFACSFRQMASPSIRKQNALSLLSCYRKLKGKYIFPSELNKCIAEVKWLRTRLGVFNCPGGCVLYSPEWESVRQISVIPFIDDSTNYYGEEIHEYRKELELMGVIVDLESGVEFVAGGLCFPQSPRSITAANAMSLLNCVRILLKERNGCLPKTFLKKLSEKWLKTTAGYRSPDQCLVFDDSSGLKRKDGPFIDMEFYGPDIKAYIKELNAIGVIVEVDKWCTLIANHLPFHSEFGTIIRIYNFLKAKAWRPESDETRKIWIPNGMENGCWVDPDECVLHDKDDLFGSQLNVLEKHYQDKVPLYFFSGAFCVRSNPSFDDYCKLWKVWETSRSQLSHEECCAFWSCVIRHKSSKSVEKIAETLVKLPVDSGNSDGILLSDKHDVFIADDLLLKELFVRNSPRPIFVWYPQPSLPCLPRTSLLELYRKVGVHTISESVQKKDLSITNGLELKQVNPGDIMIGKGLMKLILGFLSGPSFKMEVEERHEAIKCLLNVQTFETSEPVSISYTLSLSSEKIPDVKARRVMRWDRESSKLFTQRMDKSAGQKHLIEYATYFSEAIAEGVLWEKEDQIREFSELIKVGFLLEFDEEAVGFLLKSKNLQVFVEDEEFLSATYTTK